MPNHLKAIRQNPLIYPGTAPGYDPSHHVAMYWPQGYNSAENATLRHSIVTTGNGATDLLTGKLGTPNGATSVTIDSTMGPCIVPASSSYISFTSDIATYNQSTFAGIFSVNTGAVNCALGGAGGRPLGTNASNKFDYVIVGVVDVATTITAVNKRPYFMACARTAGVGINFVVTDLVTGAISSQFVSDAHTQGNWASSFYMGTDTGGVNSCNRVAAVAVLTAALPMEVLLRWAQDPWSYWYPRGPRYRVGAAAGGTAYTISAAEGTYSLTGEVQSLNSSRKISAVEGTYSLTGESVTLAHGPTLFPASGTYSLTGKPQTLNRGINISSAQGSYTLTGESQTLGVGILSAQGNYSLSGKAQSFAVALSEKVPQGTYGVTGNPQVLSFTPAGTAGQAQGHRFIGDVGSMTEQKQ